MLYLTALPVVDWDGVSRRLAGIATVTQQDPQLVHGASRLRPLPIKIRGSRVDPGHFATTSRMLKVASKAICVLMECTFFLLTNTSSSIDGAIICMCVPSIAPTTPGIPACQEVGFDLRCWLSKGNRINCWMILMVLFQPKPTLNWALSALLASM